MSEIKQVDVGLAVKHESITDLGKSQTKAAGIRGWLTKAVYSWTISLDYREREVSRKYRINCHIRYYNALLQMGNYQAPEGATKHCCPGLLNCNDLSKFSWAAGDVQYSSSGVPQLLI
jgi:hypothetical protein